MGEVKSNRLENIELFREVVDVSWKEEGTLIFKFVKRGVSNRNFKINFNRINIRRIIDFTNR